MGEGLSDIEDTVVKKLFEKEEVVAAHIDHIKLTMIHPSSLIFPTHTNTTQRRYQRAIFCSSPVQWWTHSGRMMWGGLSDIEDTVVTELLEEEEMVAAHIGHIKLTMIHPSSLLFPTHTNTTLRHYQRSILYSSPVQWRTHSGRIM